MTPLDPFNPPSTVTSSRTPRSLEDTLSLIDRAVKLLKQKIGKPPKDFEFKLDVRPDTDGHHYVHFGSRWRRGSQEAKEYAEKADLLLPGIFRDLDASLTTPVQN